MTEKVLSPIREERENEVQVDERRRKGERDMAAASCKWRIRGKREKDNKRKILKSGV